MKRIIITIAILLFTCMVYGQTGSGTEADPYRGDINTTVTWSSGVFPGNTIYIGNSGTPSLRVVSNGHLTIEAGLTLIFTRTNSNLIVTGSGILNANGASGNTILFTKHPDNARWGHVSFETPGSGTKITGTGSFNYCIFEYGYAATSGTDPSNAGGAIQVNADDVVIENSIFRYNYSNFGGAVTMNAAVNTVIRNCYFLENTGNQAGGAILTWTNSTPVIENCIFEANHCNGVGSTQYSGGAIWALQNTTKISNSTFVNNTSARAGDALYSYGSANMRVVNSIFWGSNDQIAGNTNSSTLNYSAIEGSGTMPFSNSFWLNSSNTALDGPNFVNPSTGDWHFTLFSPLRDTGTDSFTGVTIPATDYDGNPRVHTTDIGAYEYQYSRWRSNAGTTDWATSANWHGGVPGSNRDVIIPATADNFPTTAPGPDVIIGAARHFIMEPGARLTANSITNNGNLLLRASETQHSSLIAGSYSGNDADIEIYLQSGTFTTAQGEFNRWHYIASPFTSLHTDVFTDTTLNLAQWVESEADPELIYGWIAFDGYQYGDGGTSTFTFNNLTPGIGYNYYYTAPVTYNLTGKPNTANVSRTLHFTDPNEPAQYGLNLTGNPFPSGLNWDAITSDPLYPENTSKVLHYTKDDAHVYYVNGIGSIPGMNGIIPPMQGFFVKTYNNTSPNITLAASARVHDNIPQRYKGASKCDCDIPHLRLSLYSGGEYNDNTVVRFDNNAKPGYDLDFDAVKRFISDHNSSVYTLTEGRKYAINGQPFPEESLELPLHLNLLSGGSHTITLSNIEGLHNYRVRLIDTQENINLDLKVTPEYSFTSPSGTITDRFIIKISDLATNTEIPAVTEGEFRTWHSSGMINIVTENEVWDGANGDVTLIDITGRRIATQSNIEFRRGTPAQVAAPRASGIYIVEITSGQRRWTGRIVIRN